MDQDHSPPHVQPRPQPVKTIGTLNIIFGVLLLVYGLCCGVYMAFLPFMGSMIETQQKLVSDQVKERKAQQLADLTKRQQEAESEAIKAQIQAEIVQVEQQTEPVMPATMNFDMFGFKNPIVIGHYAIDILTGLILNVLMLISGIGLLRLREWARKLAIGIFSLKIIRLIVLTVSLIALVSPITTSGMAKAFQDADRQANQQAAAAGGPVAPAPPGEAAEMARSMTMMSALYGVGFCVAGIIYPAIALFFLTRVGSRAACQSSVRGPSDSVSGLDS